MNSQQWFTSDTHFCHTNIIKYSNRPFNSVQEMNQKMIDNWNALVKPVDTVYHLGDFCLGVKDRISEIRRVLSGNIVLIKGNHDRSTSAMIKAGFSDVRKDASITLSTGIRCYLRHKPDYEWTGPEDLHLCGHVHNAWIIKGNMLNVGVDVWGFEPIHELVVSRLLVKV